MYNQVVLNLSPVEEPLVIKSIQHIDEALEIGVSELQWISHKVEEFINRVLSGIESIYKTVFKMKDDLQRIEQALEEFNVSVFPKKTKSVSPEEFFSIHQASINSHHSKVKAIGQNINKLIKETNEGVKVDKKSKSWLDYQEYINNIVINSLSKAINTSLLALTSLVSNRTESHIEYQQPWFEISLQVYEGQILY